ncbi:MAG TPA: ABC transporter transmembrane domain-containing protein, partial [Polyangiales bacterium]|nr:ABC transporter transmembrane domain-containing protein [Polyangiales bacterium]
MSAGPGLRLLAYVRPHRKLQLQGILLVLLTNAFDKSIPWLLRDAIDALVAGRMAIVMRIAVAVIAIAIAIGFVRTIGRTRVFNVGRDVEFSLRADLLARLHQLGPSFFQRMSTGEIMSRAINDLSQVRVMVGFGVLNVVNSTFAYAIALGCMLSMSPSLTLWAIAPFPLLLLVARLLGKSMFARSAASQEALGALSTRVQESLSGVRLVRAF